MASKTLSKSQAEKIAKEIGGKVNQGSKGNYRVEYKVRGAGYKSTKYINSLDESPNYEAPRANPRDPVSHETSGYTPGLRPAGSDLTYDQGAKVPAGSSFAQKQANPLQAPVVPQNALGTQAPVGVGASSLNAATAPVVTPGATPTPTQNRYQTGLAAAQSAGLAAPADAGVARATASSYLPAEQQDTSVVDNIFSQDPVIGQLMGGIADLLSSKNQVPSIMEDYRRLRRQSGLDDINEELIDAETILDGTEDDIRNEIQVAGGFGTESQVQAMTLSRNKNLLKRYNQLVQMKTDATNQLNTMLTLTQQDRQMAQERVNTQISAMFNMANFRQTALQNTRAQQQFMIQTMGADGYYATVSKDPRQLAMAEQIMGVAPGGLQAVAAQATAEKQRKAALEERQIRATESNAALGWARLNFDKSGAGGGTGVDLSALKVMKPADAKAALNAILATQKLPPVQRNQIAKGLAVLNKVETVYNQAEGGKFKGASPLRGALSFIGRAIPGQPLTPQSTKNFIAAEADTRQALINYITGAAYTSLQAKDVNDYIPNVYNTDATNRNRVNNLTNSIIGDIEASMNAAGANTALPRAENMFDPDIPDLSGVLQTASPEQREQWRAEGLI